MASKRATYDSPCWGKAYASIRGIVERVHPLEPGKMDLSSKSPWMALLLLAGASAAAGFRLPWMAASIAGTAAQPPAQWPPEQPVPEGDEYSYPALNDWETYVDTGGPILRWESTHGGFGSSGALSMGCPLIGTLQGAVLGRCRIPRGSITGSSGRVL